jgi:tetratricopeptide (TPR) repeat protein
LRLAGADLDAVPHLVQAAADAREVAALEESIAYLQEALAIAPERAELWLELGELEAWRGRRDQAESAFGRALSVLGGSEPLKLVRAWLRRGRAYHGPICIPRAVLDSARRALELLGRVESPADEERSEAIAACAWAEAVAGSVDEAERLLEELSKAAAPDQDVRTYDAGHARQLALMRRGKFVESYGPSIAAGEAIARAGRPDQAYGCWANAAGAAAAAGECDRALEFLDRGMAAIDGHGLQSIEIQLLGARSFILRRLGRFDEARAVAESELLLAERLAQGDLLAMAHHDQGLIALDQGEFELAAELLERALVDGAPISRPLTRLALAEALARAGEPDRAAVQAREMVLEPVGPSDFPDALVPRLARIQGLTAAARGEQEEARLRLKESIAGWQRLLERTIRAESITSVLADLGRPVVGLVEPARELARARADLEAIQKGTLDAVVH